jgi:hypothetical protein
MRKEELNLLKLARKCLIRVLWLGTGGDFESTIDGTTNRRILELFCRRSYGTCTLVDTSNREGSIFFFLNEIC